MQPEFDDRQRKLDIFKKSMTDLVMGPLYILFGGFALLYKYFHLNLPVLKKFMDNSIVFQIFAVASVLYGGWRVYRGIRKDYYR